MTSLHIIRLTVAALTVLLMIHQTSRAESVALQMEVDESKPGSAIPSDFLGYSYEKNVLALDHFKPSNTAIINLMRHLGGGVLRFGANYVETTRWEPDAPKYFSKGGEKATWSWAPGLATDPDCNKLADYSYTGAASISALLGDDNEAARYLNKLLYSGSSMPDLIVTPVAADLAHCNSYGLPTQK